MNKLIISLIVIGIVGGCFAYAKTTGENSVDFLNALKNCSEFKSQDTIEVDNMTTTVTKHIVGWDGYTCKYKEIVEFKELGFKSKVNCEFSGEQVREIYGVMEKEAEEARKNPEKYKNMDLKTAQNSPVLKVWNKYLGDSSVCKIEM